MVCILVSFDESSLFIMIICRSIHVLHDRSEHGGSFTDLDSLIHWLSLASSTSHFVSWTMDRTLEPAQQNPSLRRVKQICLILNRTSLRLDSAKLCFLLVNLIHKADEQQLTELDVLQFVTSLLFFTNIFLQPAVAIAISSGGLNSFSRITPRIKLEDQTAQILLEPSDESEAQTTFSGRSNRTGACISEFL